MSKKDQFLKILKGEVGYRENGKNNTKYGKYFDTTAWQFFNTHKNFHPWCSLLPHWGLCQIMTAKNVRKLLGEPEPKKNCGAGVEYLWNYLLKVGKRIKSFDAAEPADIIFFGNLEHVGTVEYVDNKIHTIEGNKGDAVKRCAYTFTSKKIYGIIRLDWSRVDISEIVVPFKIEPAVSFDKYYARSYEVTCNCQLLSAVRKNTKVIKVIKKGTMVRCYGYYTGNFLYVKDGNFEGYICKNHLRG